MNFKLIFSISVFLLSIPVISWSMTCADSFRQTDPLLSQILQGGKQLQLDDVLQILNENSPNDLKTEPELFKSSQAYLKLKDFASHFSLSLRYA